MGFGRTLKGGDMDGELALKQVCLCCLTALICFRSACLLAWQALRQLQTAYCMVCANSVNEACAAALLVSGVASRSRLCLPRLWFTLVGSVHSSERLWRIIRSVDAATRYRLCCTPHTYLPTPVAPCDSEPRALVTCTCLRKPSEM